MKFLHHFRSLISLTLLLSTCSKADDQHHKRVPSGFTGVRGKKSIPDDAYAEDVENNNSIQQQTEYTLLETETQTSSPLNYLLAKRAPSGFFGMRGKKPWTYAQYPEELYKRAPMGFVGMRGKKDVSEDRSGFIYDDPLKRAQMGFFGMRGKKFWIGANDAQGDSKRAPMGFVGMRGKKDFEDPQSYYESDKRAPSGFFGMRGKKQPSGFFGMRGKKYPYEFRGKFVGVRGKKSSDVTIPVDYYGDSNMDKLSDELDINQLMLLLTDEENGLDRSQ
ncbi:tachykinins [Euwallacea fornicatus]|uniref:tachykinins n=1 Tax=Euwallacea fornicatus TaxID=995702 RepID=UPI0033906C08